MNEETHDTAEAQRAKNVIVKALCEANVPLHEGTVALAVCLLEALHKFDPVDDDPGSFLTELAAMLRRKTLTGEWEKPNET